MKTCPYCAEEIKDAAIRCRWCLTWLVEHPPPGAEGSKPPAVVSVSEGAEPEATPTEQAVVTPEQAVATTELTTRLSETPVPAPVAGPATSEPARQAAASEARVEFTHTGARYLLGYAADHFGIWDRNAPQQPMERFPRTDEGWAAAWQRYTSLESNWMDLRSGQRSS